MDPVRRAIWFVEGHIWDDFGLDDVAEVAGLSRHYLVRAFGWATGRAVMRYVRARRLTEAARRLADGAPDILSVALEAGYGSHEAFTRAFRDQFGVTPEQVRARGGVEHLDLVEPIRMETTLLKLPPPRIERAPAMLLAGLVDRYRAETTASMPNQWRRFTPWIGNIPGQKGNVAYGVIHNSDDEGNTDYLTGVEVSDFADLPTELSRLRLPPRRYAVFAHAGHISEIASVWRTIYAEALPSMAEPVADGPILERYGEEFDAQTGDGGFEIWIPLEG